MFTVSMVWIGVAWWIQMFKRSTYMSKNRPWISHRFNRGIRLRFWSGIPYLTVALTCFFIGWSLWSELRNLRASLYLVFPFLVYGVCEFGAQGLGWFYGCLRSDTHDLQVASSQESLSSPDVRIHVIGWIIAFLVMLSLPLIVVYLMGV